MKTIREIYEAFDAIGCVTFSTAGSDGYPESRIAHFFAFDDDGIYFRTMNVKPFYREVKASGRVSACGMYPATGVTHDEKGLPFFMPGYTVRITGDARELSYEEVEKKAETNRDFYVATFDIKKYPRTVVFVIDRARGEIYDFDYEKQDRDHKLERERFCYGGMAFEKPGFTITADCVGCGACSESCTFDAIEPGTPYKILGNRCDECGNCVNVCPAGAVRHKCEQ